MSKTMCKFNVVLPTLNVPIVVQLPFDLFQKGRGCSPSSFPVKTIDDRPPRSRNPCLLNNSWFYNIKQ